MKPIAVLHIPHSSTLIPVEERESILLSDENLKDELLKMTDWFTDELFDSGNSECEVVRYPVSRLVLDPERFEDDAHEAMASRGMGVIYTKTSGGDTLRIASDPGVRKRMLAKYYAPHHARLTEAVATILSGNAKALVIDCHSFPSSPLPYEADQDTDRPDICIGTDPYHTPDWLTAITKAYFTEQGFSVEIDRPFSGALVPLKYYQKESAVLGMMIEINRGLYMDEKTGDRLAEFEHLKQTVSGAISEIVQRCRENNSETNSNN